MKRRLVGLVGVIAVVAAVSLLVAAPASAGTHFVSGYSYLDQMTGGLEGTWTSEIDWNSFQYDEATGVMKFRVTEEFMGTVKGVGGGVDDKLFLKGFVVQRFKPGTNVYEAFGGQNWISGGCVHRITGGTGAFEDASGVIVFRDISVWYDSNYWGIIRL